MIPDNYKPIRQVGNGKTTSFSFDFPMLSENFIKVYREKDGIQELVDPSEYVWGYLPVEGDEPAEDLPPENVITFYEAPEEGTVIVIAREIPLEQTTPYKTSSGFPAVRVEDNFDKLTAITQQLMEEVDRCVKVEITGDQTSEELLAEVYGKLDSATEVAKEAVEAAKGATEAVASAEKTLAEVNTYVDESKTEINELITKTTTEIDQTIAEATEEIKEAAVAEADKAVQETIGASIIEAATSTEHARIWAEGEQAEVKPLGGELSSMGAADLAYAIANAPEDTPIDASGLFAMNVVKGEKGDKGDAGKDGVGHNVGDIFYTSRLDTELNGAVECNGGVYSTADFEGKQNVGNLLANGSLPYVSLEEYTNLVSANGSCRAFGWDGGAEFRVPLLNDVYIEAGTALTAGEFISESLPNITGDFSTQYGTVGGTIHRASGAMTASKTATSIKRYNHSADSNEGYDVVTLNASRSSSTYKDGAKVNPDSVRYRAMVQLANAATDEALITATSALQQIGNKAEIDLSNVSSIASNTSSLISGLAMPSSKYIDLTLGASGTAYTAPANGWIYVRGKASAVSQYLVIYKFLDNGSAYEASVMWAHAATADLYVQAPVLKGEKFKVSYTAAGTSSSNFFRFHYAEGEN